MNFDFNSKKSFAKWIIGIFTICILIFLGVQNFNSLLKAAGWALNLTMPLLLGLVLALVLDVPMKLIETNFFSKARKPVWKKLKRPISLIVSLLIILAIVTGIVMLVIPELVEAVKVIIDSATNVINKIKTIDKAQIAQLPFGNYLLQMDWDKLLDSAQPYIKDYGTSIMNSAFDIVGSLVGGVVNFIIALFFAIYVLFSKETLKSQAKRLIYAWLPERAGKWTVHSISVATNNFHNFVSGQTLEAVILGVLCMLGMFILRLPYAPMVGALVGVTALIPVVGAFIGAAVGAFMILTVDPIKAVIFVVFLLILQQIEGNLIYPKVMGDKVNLPALWILAAVTIGGGLVGPVGMLLSVPAFSTIYTLVKEATQEREEKIAEQEVVIEKENTEE